MTHGKGSYRMEVDHYGIVPQPVAEKSSPTPSGPSRKKKNSRQRALSKM